MERELIYNIREQLKSNLSEHRYQHTLGVEYTAAALAMRYGADIYKAELAGLLHDCAKEYSNDVLQDLCGKSDVPKTLHAVYGPVLAKEKYGINDAEILASIRWHTTGKANMTLLEKIIYVADFIEPSRKMITILPEMRRLAFVDLTYTVYRISEETISYLKMTETVPDKATEECFQWLKENGIHVK